MIGSGKNQVVKTTQNYDNHNAVIYPSISIGDLEAAGLDICTGQVTVMIERIYYQLGGTEMICHSGVQSAACQTNISLLDQSKPYITIDSNIDTLVACDTTGLYDLLNPRAIDNCDEDIPVTISVVMDETDACYSSKGSKDTTQAIVTFTAVDACGNVGTTTRRVTIIRPNTQEHLVHTTNEVLDCTESMDMADMPGLQIGAIRNGEFIVRDTIALSTEEYICGYILTSKEFEVPTTDCGEKIYRYWSIVDWCTPGIGPVVVDTQLITYTDTQAPVIVADDATTQILTIGAFDCTYDITTLFPPRATDNCSRPSVRMDAVFRVENGLPWPIPADLYTDLDVDSFYIRWVAKDACDKQLINDTLMQLVIIKDETRPTTICTDQLNISIGSNVAIIDTADIDAGSYDACGIANKEISRDGVNFGPTVAFSCDDINDTIQVFFRVTDIHGNTNSCWLNVLPEDKIRPICTAFPVGTSFANGTNIGNTSTVRVDCNESKVKAIIDRNNPTATELAAIGGPLPLPLDNCPEASNIELTPLVLQIGTCGQDIYQRRWIAQDIWGMQSIDTCTQTISIDYVEDWEITFPEDANLVCPMSPGITDSVRVRGGHCDRLAVSVESQMFDVVPDACFKIIKTYHIINWCNYNPGDAPTHTFSAENMPSNGMLTDEDLPNFSYITFTQVIKVDDNEGPIVIVPEMADEDACIIGAHDGLLETVGDPTSCGELKTFSAFASDCVTEVGGTLGYTYRLYRGTEAEVIAGDAFLFQRSTVTEPSNTAEIAAFVTPGTYTAEFVFTDNCGNATLARNEYTFKECKSPTPYLLNGIAIELGQQTGSIDIWANDFNQGSYDNCTEQEDLRFRMWHVSLGFNPPTTAQGVLDSLPTAITFNCNFLGTQVVQIYIIDESDNFDFASTFVMIQDNMRACDGSGDDIENMIAGEITTFNGESIEDVMVTVNGAQEMMTPSDGHYQFMLPKYGNYTITPEKNNEPLNGVSTFDLVLISKHILGLTTFDSPYKYIAADINKSGTITAFDMVQLRQLILNVHTEFPNNQSWRFVDGAYNFTSAAPMNEVFRESITIDSLTNNLMQTDFVGVKIGDVNGNATTNSLLGAEARETRSTFNFQVSDQLIQVDETINIPVKARDIEDIEGYQFTLDFGGLELLEIEAGLITKEYFNTNLSKDKLTTSWNGVATSDAVLFTLKMKSTINGYLHNVLQVTSEYTAAEAYHSTGELLQVAIDFQPIDAPLTFQLDQNAPNPFNEETVIGFTLPEAGLATLKIMDIQGKVLRTIRNNFDKGYNQVNLDAKTLGVTGILHYQLETGSYIANKKMIIIE